MYADERTNVQGIRTLYMFRAAEMWGRSFLFECNKQRSLKRGTEVVKSRDFRVENEFDGRITGITGEKAEVCRLKNWKGWEWRCS